jgi:predicted dehydrogenase
MTTDTTATDRVVHIAVIGAGWWSQGWHLPHLARNPRAKIAAIIDASDRPTSNLNPHLLTLQQLSELYQAPIYRSMDDVWQDPTNRVDGVIVATPHATHYAMARRLLERTHGGVHIFMEKPMTTDVREALILHQRLQEQQQEQQQQHLPPTAFLVNHSANYRLQAKKAREILQSGAIGDIRHITCFMASPLLWIFDDASNTGWNEPNGTMLGNGFAWGQSCHILGWVYHVCPNLVPESVFCAMNHSDATGADVSHSATVMCRDTTTTNNSTTNNNTITTMSVSGTTYLPGNEHATPPVGKHIMVHIYGTHGALLYGGQDGDPTSGRLELRRHGNGHAEFPCGPDVGFAFENTDRHGDGPESMQAFLDACQGKRDHYVGADSLVGLRTVQTVEAMYRSHASKMLEHVVTKI